jgi:hypothetical protein
MDNEQWLHRSKQQRAEHHLRGLQLHMRHWLGNRDYNGDSARFNRKSLSHVHLAMKARGARRFTNDVQNIDATSPFSVVPIRRVAGGLIC